MKACCTRPFCVYYGSDRLQLMARRRRFVSASTQFPRGVADLLSPVGLGPAASIAWPTKGCCGRSFSLSYYLQHEIFWPSKLSHHIGLFRVLYRYPHPLQHPMDGVPLPPGIPGLGASTDPLEAVLGPFPCARLRSLPFDASLEDILVLFQGLVVIDVVLQGGGEAFVIFANPMDYQMALQR